MDTASRLLAGRGYLESGAQLSRAGGPRLESELGWHIAPGHTLGAYGFAGPGDFGAGAKWRWDF